MSTTVNDDTSAQTLPPLPHKQPLVSNESESEIYTSSAQSKQAATDQSEAVTAQDQPDQASTSENEVEASPTRSEQAANNDNEESASKEQSEQEASSVNQEPKGKPDWYLDSRPTNWLKIVVWWLYGLFKLYNFRLIPVPRYWGSYGRRIRDNRHYMYDNEDASMGIFSYPSMKGGVLKSTGTTYSAAENAICTKGMTLVVDADTGKLGSAARRYEVYGHDKFLTFPVAAQLILEKAWVPTSEELLHFTPRHPESGAYLLTMDQKTKLTSDQMIHVLETLKPACGSIFVDPGPGSTEENTFGPIPASTVVTLMGIHQNADAIAGIHECLNIEAYGLRDRIKNGEKVFIAIGGVSWINFNKRTQYEIADEFGVSPELVVLLPDHKRIIKSLPVKYDAVSLKFRYAISNMNRLRTEAAIAYNAKHQLPKPSGSKELQNLSPADRQHLAAKTFLRNFDDAEKAAMFLVEKFETSADMK